MTTPTSAGTRLSRGPAILFIPTLIALELFGGLIQGWITPLLGEIGTHYAVPDGADGLIVFCVVEARAANPLFDVRVLRSARLGVPLVLGVLVAMTMFGSQTPTVLYLSADPAVDGYGTGATVAVVGIVFALTALCSSAGAFLSPLVVRRIGVPATISASCVVMAAGMVVLITAPTNVVVVAALFGVTSLGTGVVLAALPAVVIDRAPEEASASVSGLYNTGRTLGGSLAGALVAAIITAFTHPTSEGVPTTTFAAFQVVWIVFAAILVIAAALALTLGGRRTPRSAAATADNPATIGAAS